MTNPLDAIPDYKSAWERLKVELQAGTVKPDTVLLRMDQIEAFETVTAMLKLREHST